MRISVDEAREYFAHITQQRASLITPDKLPDDGVIYYALDGVCGCFHNAHWPGVMMVHHAVKPSAWGKTVEPAKAILRQFWKDHEPEAIIGWTDQKNRMALNFARRCGFVEYGRLVLPSGTVIQQEWQSWA